MKTFIIDMDGIICVESKPYCHAMPVWTSIFMIQKLYKEENKIIIHTSRRQCDYKLTKDWLDAHDVPFHKLIMGKPKGDVYIDDKAWGLEKWERFCVLAVDSTV